MRRRLKRRYGRAATETASRWVALVSKRLDRGEAVTLPYSRTSLPVTSLVAAGYRVIDAGTHGLLPYTTLHGRRVST